MLAIDSRAIGVFERTDGRLFDQTTDVAAILNIVTSKSESLIVLPASLGRVGVVPEGPLDSRVYPARSRLSVSNGLSARIRSSALVSSSIRNRRFGR